MIKGVVTKTSHNMFSDSLNFQNIGIVFLVFEDLPSQYTIQILYGAHEINY